jgi:hypothetical protein
MYKIEGELSDRYPRRHHQQQQQEEQREETWKEQQRQQQRIQEEIWEQKERERVEKLKIQKPEAEPKKPTHNP